MGNATMYVAAFSKMENVALLGAAFFLFFFENNYLKTCIVLQNVLLL